MEKEELRAEKRITQLERPKEGNSASEGEGRGEGREEQDAAVRPLEESIMPAKERLKLNGEAEG